MADRQSVRTHVDVAVESIHAGADSADSLEDLVNDESKRGYRVAVVVFVEVNDVSADERDAGHRAVAGVSVALAGDATCSHIRDRSYVYVRAGDSKLAPSGVDFIVHDVQEVGVAAGNGYLWTKPTRKAYPRDDTYD